MGNKAEMHLYAVGADGTGFRRLGDYDATFLPSWSPDRSKIAFSWSDEIYVMNADGTDRRELTHCADPTCVDDDWPAWSPDARRIAFIRTEPGGNEHIYVVNLDGTGLDRLTDGVLWDTEPAWQPTS